MATRMAQWERNYYGALADREEKRRQLVEQEQAANRAKNEKYAAEVGMDYDSYTRAMSTKEGAEKIRRARTEGRQALHQAAKNTTAKLDSQRGKTAQEQKKSSLTRGTDMSGGQLEKAGAAPMVSRDQLAKNYAQYQMQNFSPLTKEQQNAADSYAKWTKWYSQDAMDEATAKSTQQDILRQMGRTTAPTAEELQEAAQAGNAASMGALKKQERASTVNAMDYGNYALTAGAMSGLEKRKKGQALTADESAALAEYEDLAARNGQTVEEYLKGAATDYMRAYESRPDFDEAREAYTRMQKGESLSPALDEIRQQQTDKYQGNTGVMEGGDKLLRKGNTGAWMEQWNREYQQAAADYRAQAEQLQLMRASGQATKDAIQTAQDALDATGRKLDELKAVSVLASQDYGEKSQANAEVMAKDSAYMLVNDPGEARERAYDNEYNGIQPTLYNKSYLLTDQERGIFNYLYATEGREAATQYMQSLANRLDYRYAQEREKADTALAQEHPVLASVGAVAERGGPQSIGQDLAKAGTILTGGELNPYGGEFLGVRAANTLQGTVSEGIQNPALNLLYNAGMSMADNLMAMASSAGNAGLASVQMSASAFGATAYDNLIRGGSTREAAMAGGASALTEYLTEHMGFDRITQSWTGGKNALGYKGALMQFVKGFIPEGLEEVPGNFVEEAVDGWLMGGQSARNLRIQELMRDQGMTLDQAMSQADAEFIGDTVMSFLAGGIAGGTMEAGSYVGGVHQGRSAAKADAKALSQELGVDRKTQQRALEMEYGVRTPDEKVLETAREQIETSAEAADHAAFKAQAETDGQAVTVTGMAKSGEGAQVTVKGEDGTEKTVDLAQVTFASDDLRRAYAYASTYAETDTARQFLAGYEMSRETVDNYRRGFEAAYSEGYTGRKATGGAATWAEGLNPTIRTLAQQAGRKAQERQAGRLLFSEEVDTAVRRAVEAMPREYTEGYTGVVNRVEGPLTAFESVQMAVADRLGKAFGMVYTIVPRGEDISDQKDVQGKYKWGTNHAVIALDAQEGLILSVAGHETLHYVKEWTGKNEATRAAYEDFQAFVLEKLQEAEGYDLEARIAQKQEQYRQAGHELDRVGAMEEIVADSMVTVFTREENVRDFLESQDVGLVERVVNAVKRLVKEIRAAIQRIAKSKPEAAAMLKQDADTLQEIADRFDRLGAMANAVRESEGNADNSGGNDRLSIRDRNGNEMPVGEDAYEENKRIVANMEPIVTLNGNPFEKNEREDFMTMGTKYFDSIGNVAHSPVFGDVRLNEAGIRHMLAQGITRRKTALLPAVKEVIEKGHVIMTDENHKGKMFDTAIVAGVVEWNGKQFYMGVVLRQDEGYKNSYYFHDAVFVEKRRPTISRQDAGVGGNAGIVREGDGEPSVSSILANLADYNTEFQEKFSLRDDAYMTAAQSGDTQTAQRMIDEEAEEKFARSKVRDKKGRLLKVYHGTNAQFTVFDTSKQGGVNGTAEGYGIYLSDSQEVTKNYGERQIAAYVNITNPATRWKKTITQARLAKLIKETCMRQARRMVVDGDYSTVREAVKDSWVSNYTDTYGTTMDAAYRDVAAQIIEANDSDMDVIQEVMSGMSIRSYAAAEEFYNEVLTPVTGIDGFWTTWKNRETGERHNIILAFNSEQIKSAEPVTYDDAGKIIPLGERFDKGNPDIRYSLRDVDTQNDEMTRLMQENGELRETVRQLSERLKGTERKVAPAQVRQLARRFKEDTGTRVPLKTLTENMQTAFDAMANASTTGECQAAMEMMGSIAQDMLEKSDRANRERYDQYAEMRAYFHGGVGLSEGQWQEVKRQYGGNAAFRRAIAGLGLKVLPEGSRANLDGNWNELCEQWPEFFRPDTNEGDQVEAVVAALTAVQVTYENPYGSSLPEYASDMAMLMYEEYLGMPEVKDGQTKQVEKLTRQLSEARATIREQAAQVRKVGRLEARIQEYKDAAQGRYRRQAQRRRDNQDYAKMRGQVIRQRDQLLRKLREPRLGAFIPQSMNDAVTELMRAIDFEGRLEGYKDGKQRNVLTAEAINRAKEAYLAMGRPDADGARGPFAAYVNGDLVSDFDLLAETANGKAARDLTMREMEALRNIVAGYTAAVVNEDRLFMQERKESLSAAGEEMAAGMLTRREKMKQGGLAKLGADAARKGLLKPVTVFGQFRGTPMEAAWKALRNAENVHIRNVSHAQEFLDAALKTYGQQESIRTEGSQAKRSRAKTYTTADGRKLQLTDQELMTLYATWKREQLVGTNHLLGGGFTLANAPRGTSTAPIRLAGPDLQEMIDRGLTKQQKEYVDHMVGFLSGECADWGNEVTMQLYGVEKFHEEYYIPFSVNRNYVAQEPATEQDSRLKTGSFTKALTDKASAPLEIKPFTEIWCQHVEKMSDYNAFVLPIEDMTRMMNYKTEGGERIRALVKRYYSPQTAEYIMNFLSRLNGNSATEAGGSWLNAFMSKAKGAAVTFNLSVAIQQAGSAARAMAEIDPKYFYGGTAAAAANLGKRAAGKVTGRSISCSYAELEQYAPIAILKGWGYFDTNMSRGMYQRARSDAMSSISDWKGRNPEDNPGMTATLAGRKLYDAANDLGGKLAEMGDRATWARIWEAVKLEVADTRKDLTKGSEAYFAACAERFTEVIDKTQVVDSIFQRAEWATEKGMMKQQMAFMSEPLTMYNMVYRAVQDLAGANGKEAKAKAGKQLRRTLVSITVSSAVTAALKSIVTALRDRDNEKKDEEGNIIGVRTGMDKWLDALGGNFIENMMGIGSIFTNALQSAFSYTSSGDLTTQWLSDFAGAYKELQKGAEADLDKAFYKLTRGVSSLTGIGFGSLVRDMTAIRDASTEFFARDSLAGAAWDTSLDFETRVAAAEQNYVMKKQGDSRKVNTAIYYDLMLTAYYESSFGDDFAAVVDAAIRTGGGENIVSSFKSKLRTVEERVPMAAQALMDGDMTEYSRLYEELCESAVGRRVVASMINSEYNALQEKAEKEPATSESIIAELQRDDVATDPRVAAANQSYSAAVEAGSVSQLKQAVSALKAAGVDEETLYSKVRTTYKKDYCWAVWSGDRTTAQKASEMMKGAGVGIDNATLKAWTSDLNSSYASDEMYRLMREGDGKQAHIIHKYLVQAHSSADMEAKLKKWCKTYVKGGKDEANVRAALKKMGYSQATIDGWFK